MNIEYYENENKYVIKIIKYIVRNYGNKINTEIVYEKYTNYSIGGYEEYVYFDKMPTIEEIIKAIQEKEDY